jgi:hypothetical protein
MRRSPLSCGHCRSPLPAYMFASSEAAPCPNCYRPVRAMLWPARAKDLAGTLPTAAAVLEESTCFYHPQNKASIVCDSCGRIICSLCDLPLDGQHICPECLNTGIRKDSITVAKSEVTLYDSLALALAVLPPFLYPLTIFTFITSPMALWFSIRHWNKPQGIVPRRSKLRFTLAIIASVAMILAIISFVVLIIWGINQRANLSSGAAR